jgi:PAS domain S-box-containing protein
MRLGNKLLAGFFSVALLVLLTGLFSYYFSNQVKNDLLETSEDTIEQLQILTDMTVELQNSLLYTRNLISESEKQRAGDRSLAVAAQIRESRQIVNSSLDRFEQDLKGFLTQNGTDGEAIPIDDVKEARDVVIGLADSLMTSFQYYNSLVRQLAELEEPGFENEMFNITVEPYFRNTLLPTLHELRQHYNRQVDVQLSLIEERAGTTVRMLILITIAAFILSLLLAWIIYRSISRPLHKLQAATERIGEGDLTQEIELYSKDELADLANSFNYMMKNLSRSMVSREYINNIIHSMGEMLVVTDSEYTVELANREAHKLLHKTDGDLEGENFLNCFDSSNREIILKSVNGASDVEEAILKARDKRIPVWITHSRVEDHDGESKHIFVARDVTLQKEAEQKINESLKEKNILLSEIHHRVKNNLAVISGLLEMQMWNAEEKRVVNNLRDTQLKIRSIALVHEKLYQTENFINLQIGEYLDDLIGEIQASYESIGRTVDISISCDEIHMTMNQAIPFSLLLNESIIYLCQNESDGSGSNRIEVNVSKEQERVALIITDQLQAVGDGLVREPDPSESLLMETLANQLGGTFAIETDGDRQRNVTVNFALINGKEGHLNRDEDNSGH